MTERNIGAEAESLLKFLRSVRDDRGAMADLRSLWTPARESRAWPLLARAGALQNRTKRAVAGLYGVHPVEAETGNMGDVGGRLANEHRSFDLRFQRLLACTRQQLEPQLRRIVMAAQSRDIAVNYRTLFVDLHYWGERVQLQWAASYFNVYNPKD
jgi:CRISPR type I-E-associated protein CasB/Cse2